MTLWLFQRYKVMCCVTGHISIHLWECVFTPLALSKAVYFSRILSLSLLSSSIHPLKRCGSVTEIITKFNALIRGVTLTSLYRFSVTLNILCTKVKSIIHIWIKISSIGIKWWLIWCIFLVFADYGWGICFTQIVVQFQLSNSEVELLQSHLQMQII